MGPDGYEEQTPPLYHSFLLRVWREDSDTGWRVFLKDVQTGQEVTFNDMESMFVFLLDQTEARQSETEQ